MWNKTEDKLPEEGKYVIAKHNRGTWCSDDPNVNTVVVCLRKGITEEERAKMKSGEIEDPYYNGATRSKYYTGADEHGNNQRGYNWEQFGPDSFLGQTITHWMEIPEL